MQKTYLFILFCILLAGCQESAQGPRPTSRYEEVSEEIERLKAQAQSQATGNNIRVEVDMLSTKLADYSSVDLLWRYVNQNVTAGSRGSSARRSGLKVGIGTDDFAVRLDITKQNLTNAQETNLFLVLADGASGSIFIGQEIAVPRFYYYGRWYSAVEYEFRQAGRSLKVSVRKLGDGTIMMDLVPVFSNFLNDGGSLELTELKTTVIAQPGQCIVIGGNTDNNESVATALFGYAKSSERKQTLITVTPYIQ